MSELRTLLKDYEKDYPREESPLNYTHDLGLTFVVDMLKNRKGRKLVFIKPDEDSDDGGELIYGQAE